MGLSKDQQRHLLEIARQMFNGQTVTPEQFKEMQGYGTDRREGTDLANTGPGGSTGLPTGSSTTSEGTRIPEAARTGLEINDVNSLRQQIRQLYGYVPDSHRLGVEPFKAWKQAKLDINQWDGIQGKKVEGVFRPLVNGLPYRRVSQASCIKTNHQAPFDVCTCGFYAYKGEYLRQEVEMYGHTSTPPMNMDPWLEVELYGKVIEHRLGFKAEKQRVLAIWFLNEQANRMHASPPPAHWVSPGAYDPYETINYRPYIDHIREAYYPIEVNVVDSINRIPFTRTNPTYGAME